MPIFEFDIGDTIQALVDQQFCDNTSIKKGDIITVTEKTHAYFNMDFNKGKFKNLKNVIVVGAGAFG